MNFEEALKKIRERRNCLWSRMDAADWKENDHPRSKNGQFAPKGGGESSSKSAESTKKEGVESKSEAPKKIERRSR